MTERVCAVILAAGEGRRLRPLTTVRPKALCPVGNVPLLDLALGRAAELGFTGPELVAVNASWLGEQVVAHVGDRAHLSVEPDGPLGTAGGVGRLRDWIAGRGVLVGNADAYLATDRAAGACAADASTPGTTAAGACAPGTSAPGTSATGACAPGASAAGLAALLDGWDGETVRLLGIPTEPTDRYRFGAHRYAGYCLLPWRLVRRPPAPADLVHTIWRPAERAGALSVVEYPGTYLDTGTPADYLAANLHARRVALGGRDGNLVAPDAEVTGAVDGSVIGAGAVVRGRVSRSVVWPGGSVATEERLSGVIRVGADLTVGTEVTARLA